MKKHVLALSINAIFKEAGPFSSVPQVELAAENSPVDPTKDHKRVSPEGKAIGAMLVRMVEPAVAALALEGEQDERCKSCAFRAGTVPNGCLQTQLDACKSVLEQRPFMCHVNKYRDGTHQICHGWFAATWSRGSVEPNFSMSWWDYTPPDLAEE